MTRACENCDNLQFDKESGAKICFLFWKMPVLDSDHCANWTQRKFITNGDRMRSMTDEEIVDQVAIIASWERRCNRVGLLAWLKEEADA